MTSKVIDLPFAQPGVCKQCGEVSARLSFEIEKFPYGEGRDQLILTARVPVWTCDSCGSQYTDGSAEELRHAEVCRHLERLTPAEVRAIREKYGLSQQEWSERTGFGIASVKRWETGNLIQGQAADRYLRLLINPDVFSKVVLMSERSVPRSGAYQFQTHLSPAAIQQADVFVLRKASGRR